MSAPGRRAAGEGSRTDADHLHLLESSDPPGAGAVLPWREVAAGRWRIAGRVVVEGTAYLLVRTCGQGAHLTRREREVLAEAARGLPNKLVADRLGISISSAANHLTSARRKLGLSRRVEVPALLPLIEGRGGWKVLDGSGADLALPCGPAATRGAAARLPPAQREVLEAVLDGLSNQEIALRRGRSIRTIANQISRIFRRLGASSRTDLAARLALHG